ncbi:MAG: sulfite exporter TauE/SafE family protein [Campylobacteraceae bacterium]|nr:sulfite exporter TauE/SafE family protein [Campylobacteraceae bacterium]
MDFFYLPLELFDISILIICCFIGAAISTTVGSGGGLLVIGGMSMILPPTALLSIHALTQSGSGLLRAFLFRKSYLVRFFLLFMVGSIIGYILSIYFLISLPDYVLKLSLGIGIIVLNLLPNLKFKKVSDFLIVIFGIITGFLTMFVGVMGPLIAIFLSSILTKRHLIVGTLAWCVSFQNLGKAVIFGGLGFDYTPWIFLIFLLILFSYLGTLAGKKLLDKSSNKLFKKILKVVILILGSKLIYDGIVLM